MSEIKRSFNDEILGSDSDMIFVFPGNMSCNVMHNRSEWIHWHTTVEEHEWIVRMFRYLERSFEDVCLSVWSRKADDGGDFSMPKSFVSTMQSVAYTSKKTFYSGHWSSFSITFLVRWRCNLVLKKSVAMCSNFKNHPTGTSMAFYGPIEASSAAEDGLPQARGYHLLLHPARLCPRNVRLAVCCRPQIKDEHSVRPHG